MNLAPLKQDCGVEVVSWQAGVSKQKCGFHENDGYASTPPRIYKKRDTSASGHIDATFGDEPDFTSNISVTKTETYSDESGDCVLDCEGSASTDVTDHYGPAHGDPDASCSAEWNPCTDPNPACASYWSSVDFYSKITIVTTATTVTTTGSGELSYDSTVTLSDEYTTSDLKASAIAKFGSATYPGTPGGTLQAYLLKSDDETTATGAKLRYTVSINGGCQPTWWVRFTPQGGTPRDPQQMNGVGTFEIVPDDWGTWDVYGFTQC